MKLVRIAAILLVLVLTDVLMSCCDYCPPSVNYNYSLTGKIFIDYYKYGYTGVLPGEHVAKDQFSMRIQLDVASLARINPAPRQGIFLNVTKATSCECEQWDTWTPADSVLSFRVITDHALDSLHGPGSDVTNRFVYTSTNYSLEGFFEDLTSNASGTWPGDRPEQIFEREFEFDDQPVFPGLYTFTFDIEFSNGTHKVMTGIPVYIE